MWCIINPSFRQAAFFVYLAHSCDPFSHDAVFHLSHTSSVAASGRQWLGRGGED